MTPDELRLARVNAGFGIRGFARHLRVSEHVIRRLESGQPVRPESALPVAEFFGVKVVDVLPAERERAA